MSDWETLNKEWDRTESRRRRLKKRLYGLMLLLLVSGIAMVAYRNYFSSRHPFSRTSGAPKVPTTAPPRGDEKTDATKLRGGGPGTMTAAQYQAFRRDTMARLGIAMTPLSDEWRPIKVEGDCILGWQNGQAAIHMYYYTLDSEGVLADIASAMDISSSSQTESWSTLARSVSGFRGNAFSKYVVIPGPGNSTFSFSYMERNSGEDASGLDQAPLRYPKLSAFDQLIRSFRVLSGTPASSGSLGMGRRQVQTWFQHSPFALTWQESGVVDKKGRPHFLASTDRQEEGSPFTLEIVAAPGGEDVLAIGLTIADVPSSATMATFSHHFKPIQVLMELVATKQADLQQRVFMAFVQVAVARQRLSSDVSLTHEGITYNLRQDPQTQAVQLFVTRE